VIEAAGEGSALVVDQGYAEVRSFQARRGTGVEVVKWVRGSGGRAVEELEVDVVVVDDYNLDSDWIEASADRVPTYVVDDWQRERVVATGLVNQNVDASRDDYPESRVSDWLLGTDYVLLRKEVAARQPRVRDEPVTKVLVTMGGSDPGRRTAAVVEVLTSLEWYREGGAVTVVLGPSYGSLELGQGDRRERLCVVRDPDDFIGLCEASSLVITAGGITTYELAYLGIPFVPVAIAGNHARIVEAWARRGVGPGLAVWEPDWPERLGNYLGQIVEGAAGLQDARRSARDLVDGGGVRRFLEACAKASRRPSQ